MPDDSQGGGTAAVAAPAASIAPPVTPAVASAPATAAAAPSAVATHSGTPDWAARYGMKAPAAPESPATGKASSEAGEVQPSTDSASSAPGDGSAAAPAVGTDAARIAELEAKIAGYTAFDPVIAKLKENGFDSGEAVTKRLAEQRQTSEINVKREALHNELQAKVNAGALTPEEAEKSFQERELLIRREDIVGRRLEQLEVARIDSELTSALTEHPALADGGDVIVRALNGAGYGEVKALAKLVSGVVQAAEERGATRAAAKLKENSTAAQPLPAGGGAPPSKTNAQKPAGGMDWVKYFNIKRK